MIKSDLLPYADDGKKFYEAVLRRLKPLHKSLNQLCHEGGIDYSTTWRWQQGSKPELETIKRVEKTLKKWERYGHHYDSISSSSGISPAARL